MPGTLRQPSQPSSISSSTGVRTGLMSTVRGTGSASGYRGLKSTPKIATCRSTPICGAANPAPLSAFIVSSMSATSARNSGVSKRGTGFDGSSSRGSPILNTGLIPMAENHSPENRSHAFHGQLRDRSDVLEPDAGCARAAPRGVVDDYGDGGVTQADLARERGFRHAGHADHVSAIPLEPVDFCCGFEARSLRRRVRSPGDDILTDIGGRLQQLLPHRLAIGKREIDMRHTVARPRKKSRLTAMRIVDDLIGNRQRSRCKIGAYAANGYDRDQVGNVHRVERPDIGAIVHFVRRYGVAVAVPGQKHDLTPLDSAESEGAGRLSVRRSHNLPSRDVEISEPV